MISIEGYASVVQCWLFHQQNLMSNPAFLIFLMVPCFQLAQCYSWLNSNTPAFSIVQDFQFFQYNYPEIEIH